MTHFAISARLAPTLLALPLFTLAAQAQTCPTPLDLNTAGDPISAEVASQKAYQLDGERAGFVSDFAGNFYFAASTLANGRELFRTDGTAAGTTLVADIHPTGDANPRELVGTPGRVYFFADDGVHGRELWTSDGTAAGTVMLLDANVGEGNGNYTDLALLNGKAYFGATGPVGGMELWTTDGTPAGTGLFADLNPSGASWPRGFKRAPGGGALYFHANHPTLGDELWKTDGTVSGTVLVKDVHPLPGIGSGISNFVNAGGLTYFEAASSGSGRELWVTDGTTAGTQQLGAFGGLPIDDEVDLEWALEWNGKLVFTAFTDTSGLEVWTSDGTVAGTQLFADLYPGVPSSFPFAYALVGGNLVFVAKVVGSGYEVWRAEPSGVLTRLTDVIAGGSDSFNAAFEGFTKVGGVLLFAAGAPFNEELWVTDGGVGGTHVYLDLDQTPSHGTAPRNLAALGVGAVLMSTDTAAAGRELSVVTAQPLHQVIEVEPTVATEGASPDEVVSIGNQRLFLSADVGAGDEPFMWTSAGGYVSLGDLYPGNVSSTPREFTRLWTGSEERVVFVAESPDHGRELWATDGTAAGTHELADGEPGPFGSYPSCLTEVGGRIVFSAVSLSLGYELWATDGTTAGTALIADIWPGIGSSEPFGFMSWGDKVVFGTNPGGDSRLWVTDGTAEGTHVLGAAVGLGEQSQPFADGERLFFSAWSSGFGVELWVTDGTPANTMRLTDAWAGNGDSDPEPLAMLNGELLFSVRTGDFARRLWKTDGTPAGTVEVANLNMWPNSLPHTSAVSGDLFYFRAQGINAGWELFRSDGTTAGTYRISDLKAGSPDGAPHNFRAVAGGVYFVADSDEWGLELFFSDGTEAGTVFVCDLVPGPDSSLPSDLVWIDGQLVLAADGLLTGRELHALAPVKAHVVEFGPLSTFQLRSTPAELGASITLEASGVAHATASVLAWSLPVASPSNTLVLPGSANWLDLFSAQLAGVFTTPAWLKSVPLPANANLVGLVVNVQAFELPGASLPAHASNGLALR